MVEMVTKLPIKTEARQAAVPAHGANRPWYPMESLKRNIDRLFNEFDTGFLPAPFRRSLFDFEPYAGIAKAVNAPLVDVAEKADGFEIKAELPGVDEKDIEVKLVDRGLLIRGEKKEEKVEKNTGYVMSERNFGAFERFFGLPEGIDVDKIAATFAKGVLTITLPKTHEAKQNERKIAIKAA